MKKLGWALAFLAVAPLAAAAIVTKEDLLRLAAARVSDDAILTVIRAEGPVEPLSVDDLVELRNAGLSPRVLRALAAYSPLAAPPPPVVYAPPPVFSSPSYYARPIYPRYRFDDCRPRRVIVPHYSHRPAFYYSRPPACPPRARGHRR